MVDFNQISTERFFRIWICFRFFFYVFFFRALSFLFVFFLMKIFSAANFPFDLLTLFRHNTHLYWTLFQKSFYIMDEGKNLLSKLNRIKMLFGAVIIHLVLRWEHEWMLMNQVQPTMICCECHDNIAKNVNG